MTPFDKQQQRLHKANRFARVALLAACGERVFPIYEAYWVGDYTPDVSRTVEQGWIYACGGMISPEDVRCSLEGLLALVTYYNEEDIGILSCCATLALRIVQCIDAPTDDESSLAAARGCHTEIYAAILADHAIHEAKAPGFPAEAEERGWLEKAIQRTETWQGVARRDMYSDLGQIPPKWWPAYQNARHHL